MVCLAFLVTLSFAVHHFQREPGAGYRTWTTIDGRTTEAGFAGVDSVSNLVKLDLVQGEVVQYPLHRLSEMDRKWVDDSSPPLPEDHSKHIDKLIAEGITGSVENTPVVSRWLELKRTLRKDSTFVVWIYGQLLGRVPEADEVAGFMEETDPLKRENLIKTLMDLKEFDQHFVDVFLADLLQVNGKVAETPAFADCPEPVAEIQGKRRRNPNPEIYEQWVTDQVRTDRPWNEMVKEVVSATGKYSGNPAGGYLLFDSGLAMINPARLMTAFTGVEMTCAECHDHPYVEVYQMDFFKMAAHFRELQFENVDEGDGKSDVVLIDNPSNRLRLPENYMYLDGEAGMAVSAGTWFGDKIQGEADETLREGFAEWLTAESNPRFTLNIANRLWKHVFGIAPIEPVSNLPGNLAGDGNEVKILTSVSELLVEKQYRLKEVLKVLYGTEVFLGTDAN